MKRAFLCCVAIPVLILSAFMLWMSRLPEFTPGDVRSYDFSKIALDKDGSVINVSLSESDEWCIPISLDKMGRWLPTAAVAIEDKRFYSHRGVDVLAILRAAYSNLTAGKIVSGASTITSQLIRISDPRPRTIRAKISESWRSLRIEREMSKDEILELYLNRAPFGGNIRGAEAAARSYFNKSASSLSLSESVILISLLRSPSRFRPDRFPERARIVRDRTLERATLGKFIPQESIEMAKKEPVRGGRYLMPNEASMAVTHAERQSPGRIITTTLDMKLQTTLEQALSYALEEYPEKITAAGIIVDNITGEVRAYVGNARHGQALPGAQVDCGNAVRSPGSTLKPFIYAEAFERGLLTPASLLADTPIFFRGSPPRNFDLSYRGPVSARTALSTSLNAPAVRVLRMVGYPSALARLRGFGFSHITRDSGYYTDSLILGGCEVTLIELAAAYRALANGGMFTAVRWNKSGVELSPKRAISPESAYLTTDILRDTSRVIPLYKEMFEEKNQKIAFKTGTSHGFRDAWCVGYSKNYTVVIWLGSPLGLGDSILSGAQSAAPVALKVIREIWGGSDGNITKPEGVYSRVVCAVSGALPTKNCRQRIIDLAIKDVSPFARCAIHKNIDGVLVTAWPASLSTWMRGFEQPGEPTATVRIIRPLSGSSVILKDGALREKLFLSAEGSPPYYWYIDGVFLGADPTGDGLFAEISAGSHRASVMSGNATDSVLFSVSRPQEILSPGRTALDNIIN